MKLKYQIVDVVLKDRANIPRIAVAPWEVPILEAIHAGGVSIVKDIVQERAAPSSDSEYDRLQLVYGRVQEEDGAQGQFAVAVIYGTAGEGRRRLRAAMQECVLPADTQVTPEEQMKLDAKLAASLLTEIAGTDLIGEPQADLID